MYIGRRGIARARARELADAIVLATLKARAAAKG